MTAPETPARDLDRSIAHLLMTAEANDGHLHVHAAAAASAARAGQDPALLAHHLRHATGHVRAVSAHLVKLRAAVARRLPAVARQLDDLDRAIPGNRSAEDVPRAALDMSIAHDLDSAQTAAGHVDRHLAEAQASQAADDPVSAAFNIEHAEHHVAEITGSLGELDHDLSRRIPAVARELDRLRQAIRDGGPEPVNAGRAFAGLPDYREDRCNFCGELNPCVDLECPGSGDARQSPQERAYEQTAAQFAAGSRWEV